MEYSFFSNLNRPGSNLRSLKCWYFELLDGCNRVFSAGQSVGLFGETQKWLHLEGGVWRACIVDIIGKV